MQDLGDTICALSSAPGKAGIAIVRVSGSDCLRLLDRIFVAEQERSEMPARFAVLGWILDTQRGERLDQALATYFPAPNSYTGEDVVEFSLHGSPVLVASLLDSLSLNGARLAEPGEFTMRAYLAGRMDLPQAEAIRDIIEANTLYQVSIASRQRAGELSKAMEPLKRSLIEIIVGLESAVEFVDEELPLDSRSVVVDKLTAVRDRLRKWIDSYRCGRIIRDGFSMAIVGRPNVGKSSLFNALLDQERSIVTEIPGTTRDLISEFTSLDGIPVRLLDTAGVQDSSDRVEQLGVDRSYQAMAEADAILMVIDASSPLLPEDKDLRSRLSDYPSIVVMNKKDLKSAWTSGQKREFAGSRPWVEVSAKTGFQVDLLRSKIKHQLFGGSEPERDGLLLTNLRHRQALESVEQHLSDAARDMSRGISEEFVLLDLHKGLRQMGVLTGQTSVEDILGEIFGRFCVGK
jgi:tRNA modification GTPase